LKLRIPTHPALSALFTSNARMLRHDGHYLRTSHLSKDADVWFVITMNTPCHELFRWASLHYHHPRRIVQAYKNGYTV
jgi:hypothetical protein